MTCMACGGKVAITPSLIGAEDRWDCLCCPTWGSIIYAEGRT